MLKSLIPKLAIGAIGIGSITTGIVYATLPTKYSHHLNKQGRTLLAKNSRKWAEIKKEYKLNGDNLLITLDGKQVQKTEITEDKLIFWCSQNSNNSFKDTKDEIYQKVSAWCTEPKKIKDLIDKNKTILKDEDIASQTNPNEEDWNQKKTKYRALTTNDKLIKEITGDAEKAVIQATSLNETSKLKAWCKFSKEKHFKHEEDARFLNYLEWCVK